MPDPFDIVTVACFLLMVAAYLIWIERDLRTLLQLSICAVALATANYLGSNGWPIFAIALIVVAVGYGLLVLIGKNEPRKG
jgi:hypothetical protein